MTLRDERPVNRCAVRGCPWLGHWGPDGLCPSHREAVAMGLYDPPRPPELSEMWHTDAPAGHPGAQPKTPRHQQTPGQPERKTQ